MNVLVLNHSLQSFTGSEINALQLVLGLKALGHEADIGTFRFGQPLQTVVEKHGIKVINLLTDDPSPMGYDLIWAHHSPVLTYLIFKRNISDCRILFSSLSTLVPMESPPVFVKDIHLYLSHNPVNTECMVRNGVPPERIHYFPNFAPDSFFHHQRYPMSCVPSKICVVSNNNVPELRGFADLGRHKGYHVDFVGHFDHPVFVDESVLTKYDCIVTIGKTVQYCFALRIPVYCYDRFGGPGYIDPLNYEKAKDHNFSGIGFERKLTAEELCADVLGSFSRASDNVDFLYRQARKNFCLETNLAGLLEKIKTIPVTDIRHFKNTNSLAERINDLYIDQFKHALELHDILTVTVNSRSWKLTRFLRTLNSRFFLRSGSGPRD